MKPPDRLLQDLGVLGFLLKFWFALAFVVAVGSSAWESVWFGVAFSGYVLFIFAFIVIGAKLLVSLFRMPWKVSRSFGSTRRSV